MKKILSLLFVVLAIQAAVQAQQVVDTTIYYQNEYIYFVPGNPYPQIDAVKARAVDTTGFVHLMTYAAGNGTTLDDAALIAAVNAATASPKQGLIIDAGHTYLFSKLNLDTLSSDLTIYAYGATLKMKELASVYSLLELRSGLAKGNHRYKVRWLGGTIDGNQYNQAFPLNPHGGQYAPAFDTSKTNNGFKEAHGQLINFTNMAFGAFVDVTVINSVVDGLVLEGCNDGFFYNCTFDGGALLRYNQVQEQGTYAKFTRIGMGKGYVFNCTFNSGSIGVQYSYPENAPTMDSATVGGVYYSKFTHQVQNPIHFEDCFRNFLYRDTVVLDTNKLNRGGSLHFSNLTRIASVKECEFTNTRLNFNQAAGINAGGLAIVDKCNFYSTFNTTDTANSNLTSFIEGNPTIVINSNFYGKVTDVQAEVRYVRNSTFNDFGALALRGTSAADSCTFNNGVRPSSNRTGGAVLSSCVYNNVSNPNSFGTPSISNWQDVYTSYINTYSANTNNFLARISTYMPATLPTGFTYKTLSLQNITGTPTGSKKKLTLTQISGSVTGSKKKLTLSQ